MALVDKLRILINKTAIFIATHLKKTSFLLVLSLVHNVCIKDVN